MKVNIAALNARDSNGSGLEKYRDVARLLINSTSGTLMDGVEWAQALCRDLDIPSLATFGVQTADFNEIVRMAKMTSSMKANPVVLTDDELIECLTLAM